MILSVAFVRSDYVGGSGRYLCVGSRYVRGKCIYDENDLLDPECKRRHDIVGGGNCVWVAEESSGSSLGNACGVSILTEGLVDNNDCLEDGFVSVFGVHFWRWVSRWTGGDFL